VSYKFWCIARSLIMPNKIFKTFQFLVIHAGYRITHRIFNHLITKTEEFLSRFPFQDVPRTLYVVGDRNRAITTSRARIVYMHTSRFLHATRWAPPSRSKGNEGTRKKPARRVSTFFHFD